MLRRTPKTPEIPWWLRRPDPNAKSGAPMPPAAIQHWKEVDQRRWARLEASTEKARLEALAQASNAQPSPPPAEPSIPDAPDIAAVANDLSNIDSNNETLPAPSSTASPSNVAPPSIDQTLQDLAEFIRTYLVCSNHQLTILVLWIVHTYCYEYFGSTPYLNIFSPENQSGKTVCLHLLNLLCCKPWMPSGISKTLLMNRITNSQPTLLLDDWNTLFRASNEQPIVGFLNAGSLCENRFTVQLQNNEGSLQSNFCPKAFAGMGGLPPSLADRCIPIALNRMKASEYAAAFWVEVACEDAVRLVEPIPAWVLENYRPLRLAALNFLNDEYPTTSLRQHESFAPLLAIAEIAGGKWLRKARAARRRILDADPGEPPTIGLQVLSDIRNYFTEKHDPPSIHTTPLLKYLNGLEDRPWKNTPKQKLTPHALGIILRHFPIPPSGSQVIGDKNLKGYTFRHFVESWQRYLPHLSGRRISPAEVTSNPQPDPGNLHAGANHLQVGAGNTQTVTDECSIATGDHSIGTPQHSIGISGPPIGTNPQLPTNIPNTFNAFSVCSDLPVNSESFHPEEVPEAGSVGSDSSSSAEAGCFGDAVTCPGRATVMETENITLVPGGPQSIDEGKFVEINGTQQWVTIRGSDVNNPVLFILHGTGFALSSGTPFFAPWEKYFTIVQWDQPGTGATYAQNSGAGNNTRSISEIQPLTLDRITADGIAVAGFVRRRLHAEKIIAMGISGGSIIGLKMVHQRPDLFSAYVGSGQFVHWARQEALSYSMVLERARQAADQKAVLELQQIGPPPYKDTATEAVKSKYAIAPTPSEQAVFPVVMAAMKTPSAGAAFIPKDLPPFDARAVSMATYDKLRDQMAAFDARQLGLKFHLAMFFFQGDQDVYSVTSEVQAYEAEIQAPKKMIVLVKGAGHSSFFMRDEFLSLLNTHVRPLAL